MERASQSKRDKLKAIDRAIAEQKAKLTAKAKEGKEHVKELNKWFALRGERSKIETHEE